MLFQIPLSQVSFTLIKIYPTLLILAFDIRITPSQVATFEDKIKEWVKAAGEGVTYNFDTKDTAAFTTPITDDDDFWRAFSQTLKQEYCLFIFKN